MGVAVPERSMAEPPEGFRILPYNSPFAQSLGAFYQKLSDEGRVVGVRAEAGHCNADGYVHGGFLLSFSDVALTYGTFEPWDAPPRITLSLSADFLRPARQGDWLEARVSILKKSDSLVFASAHIVVDGVAIVRSSGLFRPVRQPK